MTLEERISQLQEEVIALRALVTTLLPVIAASAAVPLDAAMDASAIRLTQHLQRAVWPPERIAQVLSELALLREDMGESGKGGAGGSTCH